MSGRVVWLINRPWWVWPVVVVGTLLVVGASQPDCCSPGPWDEWGEPIYMTR